MKLVTAVLLFSLNFSPLDDEVERLMAEGGVPGAAVVVVEAGKVTHLRGFGVTSVETKVPVTPDTLFRLGSTTKMFVALAALDLDLQKPIGALVPDLPPPLRPLTLHQLLTHTAGLRDEISMAGPLEESALETRIRGWNEEMFFAPPGEVMSYSSPGYVLAGYVISRLAKKPFSETVKDKVLAPAGMSSSTFRPLEAMTRSLAVGHERGAVIRPFAEDAANYASGSLFTSAADLGRFLAAGPLGRLIPVTVPVEGRGIRYGYGVMLDDHAGSPLIFHTGARSGYGSVIAYLPRQNVAVAILANRSSAVFTRAAMLVAVEGAGKPAPPPQPSETAFEDGEIETITGSYVNNDSMRMTLAAEEGRAVAKIGNRTLAVTKVGPNRYRLALGSPVQEFIVRDGYLFADMHALRKEE